ncbi:hypothetical protein AMTR_s05538p00002190, partial [Amborella trichopoda]
TLFTGLHLTTGSSKYRKDHMHQFTGGLSACDTNPPEHNLLEEAIQTEVSQVAAEKNKCEGHLMR